MNPLRIAVLDEELPYPLTSGKRLRTFNLLSRLAERHRITIFCHRNTDRTEAAEADRVFRRLGIETVMVDRTVPAKSGAAFYARLAGNLLSSLPYSVATHTSPELVCAVQDHARAKAVDVWHCEWTPYAQVLRQALRGRLKRIPWLVMAHNIESRIWQRYASTETNPAKRWYIRRQWKKFEAFERWAFANATWTVAVTEDDATAIREDMGGTEQTEVVDNGVDTAFFTPHRDIDRDAKRLLFLGSLDWRPNQDGAVQLLESILPAVRKHEPQATLQIVGRNPPDWLLDKAKCVPGATVIGTVPDVRPYLAGCAMTVVPLRVGGGSRLKILESLATATPVVSTRIGAEGLRLQPDQHLRVTPDESTLAEAIVATLRDPDRAADQADEGRRLVLREYDWAPLAVKLEEIWTVAAEQFAAKAER